MLFICLLFIQVSCVLSMSIGNKTSLKSNEDRIQNLKNVVKELTSQIQILNTTHLSSTFDKFEKEPVLFYAVTTKTIKLETKSTVVFDKVQLNYGGHYNGYDGVFVSPASGIYMFSWTVCSSGANYVFTELIVENSIISVAGEYDSDNYHCGSMTALVKIDKNDHAWIRTTNYVAGNSYHYLRWHETIGTISFMGLLVHRE